MTERDHLYAAVCAAPRDDLPKLVFADWLDEHGDAADRARAELIRIQCEWESDARGNERALEPYRIDTDGELLLDAAKLAKFDPVAGRALTLLQRAEELEPIAKTRAQVNLPQVQGASFRYAGRVRGLRTELRISLKRTWEKHLPEIAKLIPLRHITLNPASGNGDGVWLPEAIDGGILGHIESLTQRKRSAPFPMLALLARRELVHLKRVELQGHPSNTGLLDGFSTGEHLGKLEDIELLQYDGAWGELPGFHPNIVRGLKGLKVGHGGVTRHLASLPLILPILEDSRNRLEDLALSSINDSDDCAELLVRHGVPALAALALSECGLTARGACDLLTSDALPALRHLDVGGNVLGDLVGRRLQKAEDYPRLTSLDAGFARLSAGGIAALARWPGFVGLRKLVLGGNPFKHTAMRALTSAEAPNLRTLGLDECGLHGSHIRELVTSTFVRSLWTLDLRGNLLDDSAVRALVASPFLDAIQCLCLNPPEDHSKVARLRERFGDRLQIGR